ncbi:MAG: arginine deiminase-related protein [Bdellovibrionales bacterium]
MNNLTVRQSTNHLLMIEPKVFFLNPETQDTNVYQIDEHETHDETLRKAIDEFRAYRNCLVENGITVTTFQGIEGCPDHLFPNWASTDPLGNLVLYPMLNPNRSAERIPRITDRLEQYYNFVLDLRDEEENGLALESTGSLVMDHVNKIVYAGRSKRTDDGLARRWADHRGYQLVMFNTKSHTGKPVYHTDLVMHIGTEYAGICSACIDDDDRARVVGQLKETHDVVEYDNEQLKAFCGNSLEVISGEGERLLTMSKAAQKTLRPEQKEKILFHMKAIIGTDISTIEHYGGGSARCLIMELF